MPYEAQELVDGSFDIMTPKIAGYDSRSRSCLSAERSTRLPRLEASVQATAGGSSGLRVARYPDYSQIFQSIPCEDAKDALEIRCHTARFDDQRKALVVSGAPLNRSWATWAIGASGAQVPKSIK
jgi:hypothetical protein